LLVPPELLPPPAPDAFWAEEIGVPIVKIKVQAITKDRQVLFIYDSSL
jgi:hypothetical protein